ncbi:ABC-2 family transporter protein [Apilactobacillus kunkeei]|uniref:ABC transporter permease protein n=1 Tax=Apilactobacillus kunkeei TaxID=148814 RepID=A0A1L8CH82_9LACO|nr:ABC-2 family transporter protein [Apilactobacillus kunkeei]GAT90565.1 ABC transporter permease protein [Apilactobacillus kunkeei]
MNLQLYLRLATQSLKEFLTYRVTSFLVVVFGFMFTIIELISVGIYYQYDYSIKGISYNDYLTIILSLSSVIYTYLFLFIAAHESLSDDIMKGNLDYTLIRPLNSFLYYSLRQLDFPSLINLIVYLPLTVFYLMKYNFTFIEWIWMFIVYIFGVLFLFSINQIVVEMSFWKDNLSAIKGIPEDIVDSAKRPARFFPRSIRIILTNFLPILAISNGAILVKQSKFMGIISLILMSIIFALISYWLWKKGLKRYFSAN